MTNAKKEALMNKALEATSHALMSAKKNDRGLLAKYKSELTDIKAEAEKRIGVTLTDEQCLAYVMHWFRGHMAQVEERRTSLQNERRG